jgi:hypothetical protein
LVCTFGLSVAMNLRHARPPSTIHKCFYLPLKLFPDTRPRGRLGSKR